MSAGILLCVTLLYHSFSSVSAGNPPVFASCSYIICTIGRGAYMHRHSPVQATLQHLHDVPLLAKAHKSWNPVVSCYLCGKVFDDEATSLPSELHGACIWCLSFRCICRHHVIFYFCLDGIGTFRPDGTPYLCIFWYGPNVILAPERTLLLPVGGVTWTLCNRVCVCLSPILM